MILTIMIMSIIIAVFSILNFFAGLALFSQGQEKRIKRTRAMTQFGDEE